MNWWWHNLRWKVLLLTRFIPMILWDLQTLRNETRKMARNKHISVKHCNVLCLCDNMMSWGQFKQMWDMTIKCSSLFVSRYIFLIKYVLENRYFQQFQWQNFVSSTFQNDTIAFSRDNILPLLRRGNEMTSVTRKGALRHFQIF